MPALEPPRDSTDVTGGCCSCRAVTSLLLDSCPLLNCHHSSLLFCLLNGSCRTLLTHNHPSFLQSALSILSHHLRLTPDFLYPHPNTAHSSRILVRMFLGSRPSSRWPTTLGHPDNRRRLPTHSPFTPWPTEGTASTRPHARHSTPSHWRSPPRRPGSSWGCPPPTRLPYPRLPPWSSSWRSPHGQHCDFTLVGEIWNRGMLLKVIYQSCIFVKMLGGNRQEMLGGNNFHPASRCYPTHWKLIMYSSLSEHEAQPRFHNYQNSFYGTGTALKQIPITECQGELHPLSRTVENTSYHGRWPTCNP